MTEPCYLGRCRPGKQGMLAPYLSVEIIWLCDYFTSCAFCKGVNGSGCNADQILWCQGSPEHIPQPPQRVHRLLYNAPRCDPTLRLVQPPAPCLRQHRGHLLSLPCCLHAPRYALSPGLKVLEQTKPCRTRGIPKHALQTPQRMHRLLHDAPRCDAAQCLMQPLISGLR